VGGSAGIYRAWIFIGTGAMTRLTAANNRWQSGAAMRRTHVAGNASFTHDKTLRGK
jgi:hypothetical protein